MKKALIAIVTVIQTILRYFTIVIDRLAMAPFIGTPLPDINYKKEVPKVDENTTDEEIQDIVELEDRLIIKYFKEYLPKARRRALTVTLISIEVYMFISLSWLTIAIATGTGATIYLIVSLVKYLIKRAKNKPNDTV